MKFIKIFTTAISIFLLASCANKPPSCDDSSTIDILKNIINKELDKKITDKSKFDEIKNVNFIKFEKIKNNGYNEKEEKFSCTADAIISLNINPAAESIKKMVEILKISNALTLDDVNELEVMMINLKMAELGLDKITSLRGASIINNEILTPITYTSFHVTNSNKDKQIYVESNGIPPLISATYGTYKLHINSLKNEKASPQSTEKTNGINENVVNQKKMMGDVVDANPNAEPNTLEDKADKKNNKAWQDKSGIMHFPDGSATSGSVD